MAESKLDNEHIFKMLGIIAEKYGCKLDEVDFDNQVISLDCPDDRKVACATEVASVMQTILE